MTVVLFGTPALGATNVAPVIKGTPATSIVAGQRYTFRPSATDANRDRIRFSVGCKPAWATFNTTTGELAGTPPKGTNATFANVIVTASDGKLSSSLKFSIRVTRAPNAAPTISGGPPTLISASTAYSFKPKATDSNGDLVTFSIKNKPSWANFSIATGQLSGTAPSKATSTTGIVISASDGKLTASLPAFSINVIAPTSGTASLSWVPPTHSTDGTALTNLAGYRLYFGSNPLSLTQIVPIVGASNTAYVLKNLSSGKWYFAISAYTTSNVESALSAVMTKSIP